MILARPGDVGRLVRQRRTDVGLQQSKLAGRVGITRQLLSRFEQGKSDLPLAVALRLLRELDLSVDVRTREERAGVVELRLPTIDPSRLAELSAQSLAGLREALATLSRSLPRFDSRELARLQEVVATASASFDPSMEAAGIAASSRGDRDAARDDSAH